MTFFTLLFLFSIGSFLSIHSINRYVHISHPGGVAGEKFDDFKFDTYSPDIVLKDARFPWYEPIEYLYLHPAVNKSSTPPTSRIFALYVPESPRFMNEIFSFIESWRYVFNVPDPDTNAAACQNKFDSLVYGTLDESTERNKHKSRIRVNDILIIIPPLLKYNFPLDCKYIDIYSYDIPSEVGVYTRTQTSTASSRCYILEASSVNSYTTSFQEPQVLKSLSIFADPIVHEVIVQYDLLMRLDCDTFLFPALRYDHHIPWIRKKDNDELGTYQFWTGQGGFTDNTSRLERILYTYSTLLGLRWQGGKPTSGSTWYGTPQDIHAVAKLTTQIAAFLLHVDPTFIRGPGRWPIWFRPTVLLYAAQMSIRHMIDNKRHFNAYDLLDVSVKDDTYVHMSDMLSGHAWHGPGIFDKFEFLRGLYNTTIFESKDYDPLKAKYYALRMTFVGVCKRELICPGLTMPTVESIGEFLLGS